MKRPGRLLVVDDEPGIAAVFRVWASRMDFEVEIVQRRTAMSECARFQPDVILLDPAIPKPGPDVLKQLAASESRARLILMTSADEGLLQKTAQQARAVGLKVLDVIEKPLDFDALTRLLRLVFDTESRD